jgi:hypothetical protein
MTIPTGKSPKPSNVIGDFSNQTNCPISASSCLEEEAFFTLAQQFAPTGHSLHVDVYSNIYYVERWGHVRYCATLEDARKFLVKIGGAQ